MQPVEADNEHPVEGEWALTLERMRAWQVTGLLALLGGIPVFFGWSMLLGGGIPDVGVSFLWGLLALVPLLLFHELVHGLAFRWAGAEPRYGYKVFGGVPMLYATAPGQWFSRDRYIVVAIAPTFAVSILGMALMLWPPLREPLAAALTLHLSGCVGDWAFVAALRALPPGTLCEDRETGFGYRLPGRNP